MKRALNLFLALVAVSLFVGCTAETSKEDEDTPEDISQDQGAQDTAEVDEDLALDVVEEDTSPDEDMEEVGPEVEEVQGDTGGDCDALWSTGEGDEVDPYLLGSAADFFCISEKPSASYLMIQDVDFGTLESLPLASTFRGVLEGDDHSISYEAVVEGEDHIGFFGELREAEVSSLFLVGELQGESHVGFLAGAAYESTVSDVYLEATVVGTHYVGGLVGYASETWFMGCHVSGAVTGDLKVGGMVGESELGTIIRGGANQIIVTATQEAGGGVVGSALETELTSLALGDSTLGFVEVGGGGPLHYGGVVGFYSGGSRSLSHIHLEGRIQVGAATSSNVGGVVGELRGGGVETISVVNREGWVQGDQSVGGFVGRQDSTDIVQVAVVGGVVNGEGWVGGISGSIREGSAEEVAFVGEVNAESGDAGGLVGRLDSGTLQDSFAWADISGASNHHGGLVGRIEDAGQGSKLLNTYAVGNVLGQEWLGGLVGYVSESAVGAVELVASFADVEVAPTVGAGYGFCILGYKEVGVSYQGIYYDGTTCTLNCEAQGDFPGACEAAANTSWDLSSTPPLHGWPGINWTFGGTYPVLSWLSDMEWFPQS